MRFKYTPPISDWAVDRRQTAQRIFQWGRKREPYPTHAGSLAFLRYDRAIWRVGRKPNRLAVGVIRVMGAKNFFRGAYHGAEND